MWFVCSRPIVWQQKIAKKLRILWSCYSRVMTLPTQPSLNGTSCLGDGSGTAFSRNAWIWCGLRHRHKMMQKICVQLCVLMQVREKLCVCVCVCVCVFFHGFSWLSSTSLMIHWKESGGSETLFRTLLFTSLSVVKWQQGKESLDFHIQWIKLVGGTFQATAEYQDSDFFRKAIKMALMSAFWV